MKDSWKLQAFATILAALHIASQCQAQSIVTKVASKPMRNTRAIYHDESVRFLGRNYGDQRDPGGNTEPGLFVHSKDHDKWLQITEVSTKGGTFGSSRSINPEDQKKLARISVGWDFSTLEKHAYAGVPLRTSGSLVFPDKIEWDDKRQRYSLGFMTKLGIVSASTTLFIERSDLEAAFKESKKSERKASGRESQSHTRKQSSRSQQVSRTTKLIYLHKGLKLPLKGSELNGTVGSGVRTYVRRWIFVGADRRWGRSARFWRERRV